jgi:hypothetical protein
MQGGHCLKFKVGEFGLKLMDFRESLGAGEKEHDKMRALGRVVCYL